MSEPLNNLNSATGKRYWRSMDELADTPEFKEWLHREFPKGASEFTDDVSRRHFLKIMSASFALAGLGLAGAGCRRPEEKLVPFGQQPDASYVYGKSEYFATAMPTRTGAIPLVVKSYDGRPIKIEGNSLFPGSNGSTDRYAQASILNLYDPDRARHFKKRGADGKMEIVSRDEALKALNDLSQKFSANQGDGLAFLVESGNSRSRRRMRDVIEKKFPKARWFTCDAIDSTIHQRAAALAFGGHSKNPTYPVNPVFHFDKAKVILSLDCDFLGGEDDCHNHIQKFVAGRKAKDGMSRLYSVESLFSLTGASADHRLRVAASLIPEIAGWIASSQFRIPGSEGDVHGYSQWITECVNDLKAAGKNALVVAGQRQPIEVHLLAHSINAALGAVGNTVTLHSVWEPAGDSIAKLNDALKAKQIQSLVILGGNPAYHANFAPAQKSASIVRFGYYEDETFEICDWNFPAAHYLESWGDATANDGTPVPVQPLIQPLFGAIPELEFLARIAGESQTNPREIIYETFRRHTEENSLHDAQEDWKKFLFNGFQVGFNKALYPSGQFTGTLPDIKSPTAPSAKNLEVVFYRDSKVDDGRYANNGWMQELPDPITRITWDNAVLISRKTAGELSVANGDLVEISLNGKKVVGPIWIQPGLADYSLGLALGYGRERAGRVGTGVGFNAYKIFSGKYIETGATIRKTGATHVIATTQSHWSMEGRPQVREFNFDDFSKAAAKGEKVAKEEFSGKEPPIVAPLYPNPLDEAKKTALHQWGMAIDLTSCVGCNTCVVACQSENNIPIVGKDQVLRGREMHWIRIDRYYTSKPKSKNNPSWADPNADRNLSDKQQEFEQWIEDVQAVHEPMLCQQCEAAPCENVCPVNATVHDQEGLNVMAYNRCIGTRYCSNNCPYKVRRFNFLDYNKRPLSDLKGPVYPTPLAHESNGKWDMVSWWKDREYSMRPEDEWDLIKLSKNPDVTVRMRGVMEKCTYCTQRIEEAKIAQKIKAGGTDNVRLSEAAGTIPKTACQQACPAGAIVFGDISDPKSTVVAWKGTPQNYAVLGDLLTKPRTTYLARIRNPNPKMPDYHTPYSTEEYEHHLPGGKQIGEGI